MRSVSKEIIITLLSLCGSSARPLARGEMPLRSLGSMPIGSPTEDSPLWQTNRFRRGSVSFWPVRFPSEDYRLALLKRQGLKVS